MDKNTLFNTLQKDTHFIWDILCESYPKLVRFNPPIITLSNRLWRTAGYCEQTNNKVVLGYKFFAANPLYYHRMMNVILPHEIIHQADYNLFGESEKKCGHGKSWCEIMLKYGLPAEPHHNMDIPRKLQNA
jgi:predicted SprT family Zn-dependent metalloprotease